MPTTQAQLDPWDVVILSDVARAAIPDPPMARSPTGSSTTAAACSSPAANRCSARTHGRRSGYRHTELERLMPVTFERKDEPEVALIIVLDKSWSMAGQVMELCKAAAQAAIDVLADEQSVGVVTFNDGFNWDVHAAQRRQEPRRDPARRSPRSSRAATR